MREISLRAIRDSGALQFLVSSRFTRYLFSFSRSGRSGMHLCSSSFPFRCPRLLSPPPSQERGRASSVFAIPPSVSQSGSQLGSVLFLLPRSSVSRLRESAETNRRLKAASLLRPSLLPPLFPFPVPPFSNSDKAGIVIVPKTLGHLVYEDFPPPFPVPTFPGQMWGTSNYWWWW